MTDADGHSSPNSSNPLTVNYSNSPPTDLALSLDQSTISADDPAVNLSGSFTDLQTNIAHTVTIVWEDGAPSPDVTTLSLDAGETTFQAGPYTYPSIGSYTILVTVAGLDGSTTATTTVTPVLPDVMIGADIPVASESCRQYWRVPGHSHGYERWQPHRVLPNRGYGRARDRLPDRGQPVVRQLPAA